MKYLVFMPLLLMLALSLAGWAQEKRKDDIKVSNERVQKLFEAMREAKYEDNQFPELKWKDIPDLLEMGASKRILKNFPHDSNSSLGQSDCPEGVVALWLVEGIRKGGKGYASLNPFLCPPEEGNNARALKAYQEWWKQAQSLTAENAAAVDPLKGTKLRWY